MDTTGFKSNARGDIRKTLGGYQAFVPKPLPDEVTIGPRTLLKFEAASSAVGSLSGVGSRLSNPNLLILPYLRMEAVLSSRIEGTQSSVSDLLKYEAAEGKAKDLPSDTAEVANYVDALRYGLDRLDTLPLSLRLVRELHKRLMKDVRGQHQQPGHFRRTQNWIGPENSLLADAIFVPPPVDEMKEALGQWEHFLRLEGKLPLLIQLAMAHYQFEVIHPFLDGNGRVGRLLIPLVLQERGALSQPLLYLSAFLEKNRPRYYELLLTTSQRGDLIPWIEFFLEGVAKQAKDAEATTSRLIQAQDDLRKELLKTRAPNSVVQLAEHLFHTPYVTAKTAQGLLSVSPPTAHNAIRELVRREVLREVSGQRRDKMFFASKVHDAVYGDIDEARPRRLPREDPFRPPRASRKRSAHGDDYPFS